MFCGELYELEGRVVIIMVKEKHNSGKACTSKPKEFIKVVKILENIVFGAELV